jgi:hypothetical protein
LYKEGQLILAPEFQRNNVWPTAAKAYLIDTILEDKPIPLIFLQRSRSAQTGRSAYSVIDGQQRLRAIFDFLDNRLRLTESKDRPYHRKHFDDLPTAYQDKVLGYDLIIDELSGYSDDDICDAFIRMNKYVVKLSQQELRHAKNEGAFYDFVEKLGKLDFWKTQNVFSPLQLKRMRADEFSAELTILLIEGPQDKKKAVDLYYGMYRDKFETGKEVYTKLDAYLKWVLRALPNFKNRFVRKPVDLYGVIGALNLVTSGGEKLSKIEPQVFAASIDKLEREIKAPEPYGEAAKYVVAASRQTDNLGPRVTRIEVMVKALHGDI